MVGTEGKPPSIEDDRLTGEIDGVDLGESSVQVEGARVTLTGRLPEREAGQPLREAGIQIAVGADKPVLYNRVVFEVVNKAPNMQMTLTWSVNFGEGGK